MSDQVWAFWDFVPTAAEVAGALVPRGATASRSSRRCWAAMISSVDHLYWEIHNQQAARIGPIGLPPHR